LGTVETDMKVILNNRQKIDNLEDIIVRFVNEEKDMKIAKSGTMNIVDNEQTRFTDNKFFASTKLKSSQATVPGKFFLILRKRCRQYN
jgi:hypothetical protein